MNPLPPTIHSPKSITHDHHSELSPQPRATNNSKAAWRSLESQHIGQRCSQALVKLIVLGFIITAIITSWFVLTLSLSETTTDDLNTTQPSCGSSVDEARRLGCQFDVMSFNWTPVECYDRDLVEDFLARKPWVYYLRPNSTHPSNEVAFEEVALGNHESLFVSGEFHKAHCAYTWRKLHRALLSGTPIDSYISSYKHTSHCTRMLLNENIELDRIGVEIHTKFIKCGDSRVVSSVKADR